MRILKYVLETTAEKVQRFSMVADAQILSVQYQQHTGVCIWALVDEERNQLSRLREFVLYQTEQHLPENPGIYLATVQITPAFVLHVFEKV